MHLREILQSDKFVVTMDAMPPKGTDLSRMLRALEGVRSRVDGVNVPEMPSATMRLGSLPVCRILLENGFEPILQVTCRDRNRLALQSDLLGAAVLGIENVLVLGGDDPSLSDHPGAKGVFDLNTVSLLAAARGLERGWDMAGHALQGSPRFCLGASVDPYIPSLEAEIEEMQAKAEAGAEFFQTQPIYDLDAFRRFLERAQAIRVPILAGIFLLKSARMARYMNEHVPEVVVPPWVIRELEEAADPAAKSLEVALRTLQAVQDLCAGVHIMTIGWEDKIPALLDAAGL
ncbi:MAG: methylenetetrahydrofolate reductase [Anaerolineae bacterium]|nr:MAG: methylenetetrahydrofolate reductase [Anaerolineae bacterium]